jgi:hypothetical protein
MVAPGSRAVFALEHAGGGFVARTSSKDIEMSLRTCDIRRTSPDEADVRHGLVARRVGGWDGRRDRSLGVGIAAVRRDM